MKSLLQRITDYRREQRIQRLRFEVAQHLDRKHLSSARAVNRQLIAEVSARSPAQVARMERAQGLAGDR